MRIWVPFLSANPMHARKTDSRYINIQIKNKGVC